MTPIFFSTAKVLHYAWAHLSWIVSKSEGCQLIQDKGSAIPTKSLHRRNLSYFHAFSLDISFLGTKSSHCVRFPLKIVTWETHLCLGLFLLRILSQVFLKSHCFSAFCHFGRGSDGWNTFVVRMTLYNALFPCGPVHTLSLTDRVISYFCFSREPLTKPK